MKKITSLLLMSLIGLVGTLAWAGSDREDTVDRMQKSVDVLQSIMSTPDKGIQARPRCGLLPHARWLERSRIHLGWRWKLGIADRGRRCGPGHAGHERPWFTTFAV